MNMMRRLKSITSGRSSISSDPGCDNCTKRVKVDQEMEDTFPGESHVNEEKPMEMIIDEPSVSEPEASTSSLSSLTRDEKSGADQLPKEMHEMNIKEDRTDNQEEKASEQAIVNSNGTETGQIISTTIGGRNGQPKQTVSYMAEQIVGTGSFGVVFQARCLQTGETVAIKKVLQDKRYKNRELQVMQLLDHPNVINLKHHFFSTNSKDELYLNLVLEYVPETVYRISKHYSRMNHHMPLIYAKLYVYQICRALAYIHGVIGVCHRDIKPQNLLANSLLFSNYTWFQETRSILDGKQSAV